MSTFGNRADGYELMDDFSITDDRLKRSLEQLRYVNRFLGGYSALLSVLKPYLLSRATETVRILDIGTGIADFPEMVVRWSRGRGSKLDVVVTAIDANPATVRYANESIGRRLSSELAERIMLEEEDALNLPYAPASFDVAMASMFLHHFRKEDAVQILRSMNRVARDGIIINDLHRHPLAYLGIRLLTQVLPATEMVRHDGPLSVKRSFTRRELMDAASEAELENARISWRWAFRWVLTTLPA